jgi:VWFA-related protein
MAQRAEVTIFAISTNRSGSEEKGDRILKRIAEETGGRVFFPFAASDLSEDFAAIGREIRSQYSLAYFSTNRAHDGTFRKILIEPLAKNLQVRSKAGYFALTQ